MYTGCLCGARDCVEIATACTPMRGTFCSLVHHGRSFQPHPVFPFPLPVHANARFAFFSSLLQLMVRGYKKGLVKFALITGKKP